MKLSLGKIVLFLVLFALAFLIIDHKLHVAKLNKYYCFAEDRYLTESEFLHAGLEYWLKHVDPDELRAELNLESLDYKKLTKDWIKNNPKFGKASRKQVSFEKPPAVKLGLTKLMRLSDYEYRYGQYRGEIFHAPLLNAYNIEYLTYGIRSCGGVSGMNRRDRVTKEEIRVTKKER